MRNTAADRASYGGFPAITLSWKENLRGMHFKPPDQAWQPTFASGKPDDTGREETGTDR